MNSLIILKKYSFKRFKRINLDECTELYKLTGGNDLTNEVYEITEHNIGKI